MDIVRIKKSTRTYSTRIKAEEAGREYIASLTIENTFERRCITMAVIAEEMTHDKHPQPVMRFSPVFFLRSDALRLMLPLAQHGFNVVA